ncbi:hypothetical protein [Krasilnikovia sp. M28-CT-15]|uniref:hypothetical protein n=1 Tax=Krasilnikovia sp. M28-CT-15 TaxID=3373540 RepID=UPI00387622FF
MTTSDPEQPMEITAVVPPILPEPTPAPDGLTDARYAANGVPVAAAALDGLTPEADVAAQGTGPGLLAEVRRWRDAAVGAAFEAEEAAAGMLDGLRRAASRRGEIVTELAERGARERLRGRQRASTAVHSAVTAFATSSVVDRVVDAQLERVLRPVVLAVLDDVLRLLEREPDRIQALIRGQRESMVDELVTRIRTGAEAGDTAVDRLTYRVFHRGPRPADAP